MQLDPIKIKQLRIGLGWTQQQLADICGLSLRTIQRIEEHGTASLETSKALAVAFDRTRQDLIQQEPSRTTTNSKEKHTVFWLICLAFASGILSGVGLMSVLY